RRRFVPSLTSRSLPKSRRKKFSGVGWRPAGVVECNSPDQIRVRLRPVKKPARLRPSFAISPRSAATILVRAAQARNIRSATARLCKELLAFMSTSQSTNPVVQSIISGNAPTSARSAAARGLLPLSQSDLLEALVHLSTDDDPGIASAAQETLASQQPNELLDVARTDTVSPAVLGYFASLTN